MFATYKQGPNRRACLVSDWKAKPSEEYLDKDVTGNALVDPRLLFFGQGKHADTGPYSLSTQLSFQHGRISSRRPSQRRARQTSIRSHSHRLALLLEHAWKLIQYLTTGLP